MALPINTNMIVGSRITVFVTIGVTETTDFSGYAMALPINTNMIVGSRITFFITIRAFRTANCFDFRSCALASAFDAMCSSSSALNCFALFSDGARSMYLPSSSRCH
ncbi:hypothetical protein V6N11_025121 [Hibiscus sabdariffa]|uniref:Uncharacterized protein n=1 Tax=Hibiscus sabdariffa TaxID=183260 RepID=A0ABR2QP56_9ROSI